MAFIGISSAVCWLLYAKKPVVYIRVLADRNFALGCLAIFCMAFILYSSAVLIPQFAQRELAWTATWAGLVLAPGALMIVVLIPIMGKFVFPRVQTPVPDRVRLFLDGLRYGLFQSSCAQS